jgi:glycosyltransferase involved in cell wall biosynthesis
LEIVVSDNASTDKTAQICKEFAAKDSRIRYYHNELNIGVNANFCRVFELSSGEYFMWGAADDIRPPTSIESCVEALRRNKEAVMAHGPVLVMSEGQKDLIEFTNNVDLSDMPAGARIRAFTTKIEHNAMLYGLYRRSALAQAIFGDHYGQDYLLCLQMCSLGPLEYVKSPMIIYRERRLLTGNRRMYPEVPVTPGNLLRLGKARTKKCWIVLIMGCYYLARIQGPTFAERISGIIAHASNFTGLYWSRLVKEAIFQIFTPLALLGVLCWRLAHRWPLTLRFVRKVRGSLGLTRPLGP